MVAPEVRVPVLRKPSGEEAHGVPSVPAALFGELGPVGLPEGSFLMPQGCSGVPSILFPLPFPGCNQVGGDSKQDLVWEWAASKEPHQQPSPAFTGGWRALNPRGRERRAYALESLFPAPRPGGPSGARSPCP